MDLREVITRVKTASDSAYSAFHAGRHEDGEKYLIEAEKVLVEYLRMPATPAGDVTESASIEKPEEVPIEQPAEVPGDSLPATQFDRPAAAQTNWKDPKHAKPTQ